MKNVPAEEPWVINTQILYQHTLLVDTGWSWSGTSSIPWSSVRPLRGQHTHHHTVCQHWDQLISTCRWCSSQLLLVVFLHSITGGLFHLCVGYISVISSFSSCTIYRFNPFSECREFPFSTFHSSDVSGLGVSLLRRRLFHNLSVVLWNNKEEKLIVSQLWVVSHCVIRLLRMFVWVFVLSIIAAAAWCWCRPHTVTGRRKWNWHRR